MKRRGDEPAIAGFTIIEVMLVVAVLAVLAGATLVGAGNYKERVLAAKLGMDVHQLNTAIRIYESQGGDPLRWGRSAERNPQLVLDGLKTSADEYSAERMAGFTGRSIDPRLKVLMQTSREARTNGPRAIWDPAKLKFVISEGGSRGIKAFIMDERIAKRRKSNRDEARKLTMNLDPSDGWIWAYEDSATPAPVTAPTIVAFSQGTAPPPPLVPTGKTQLDPPLFSIPGGTNSLSNYDLTLTLTNPNSSTVSKILYSTSLGDWQEYSGPVTVTANTRVSAYVASTDSDNWVDSISEVADYTVNPEQLALNVSAPLSVNYAQAGGSMMPGGLPVTLTNTAMITLTNGNSIPDSYENSDVFNVLWTYDGSDPRSDGDIDADQQDSGGPAGLYQGDAFSGGFAGQSIDISLPKWGSQSTLPIQVAAKSRNSDILIDSQVTGQTVTIDPITLRAPLFSYASGEIVISTDSSLGDMPQGSRIFYTTDGTDPGDQSGEPVSGAQYAGTLSVPENTTVRARVYGPAAYPHWFNVSESRQLAILPLSAPEISFSDPGFTGSVYNGTYQGGSGPAIDAGPTDSGAAITGTGDDNGTEQQLIARYTWQNGGFVYTAGSNPAAIEIKGGDFLDGDISKPLLAKFASSIPIDGLIVRSLSNTKSDTVVFEPATNGGIFYGVENTPITSVDFVIGDVHDKDIFENLEWNSKENLIGEFKWDEDDGWEAKEGSNPGAIAFGDETFDDGEVDDKVTGVVFKSQVLIDSVVVETSVDTINYFTPAQSGKLARSDNDEFDTVYLYYNGSGSGSAPSPPSDSGDGTAEPVDKITVTLDGVTNPDGTTEMRYKIVPRDSQYTEYTVLPAGEDTNDYLIYDGPIEVTAEDFPTGFGIKTYARMTNTGSIQGDVAYADSPVVFNQITGTTRINLDGNAVSYFHNPVGDPGLVSNLAGGGQSDYVTWGSPSGTDDPSWLRYTGARFDDVKEDERFLIGTLEYFNGTIVAGTGASSVDLALSLDLEQIKMITFDFTLDMINTNNDSGTLAGDADYVKLYDLVSTQTATIDGWDFELAIEFGETTVNGFSSIDQFHVHEGESARGSIYGTLRVKP